MKQILLLIIAGVVVAGCCFRGYTVTVEQVGSNVVAHGSGAIDLTGLTFSGSSSSHPAINASDALIKTGGTAEATFERTPSSAVVDLYNGAPGPRNFGPGGWLWPESASGDLVGIMGNWGGTGPGSIFVPQGYTSGTLSSSATWNNVTLATLGKGFPWEGDGVTPGAYVWTWGTKANQNFTLIIGPTSGWWWLKACYLPFHFRFWPFYFRFPEWRTPPTWPPPRDLPRPKLGDRVLAK
jgi:hypothetical protein